MSGKKFTLKNNKSVKYEKLIYEHKKQLALQCQEKQEARRQQAFKFI